LAHDFRGFSLGTCALAGHDDERMSDRSCPPHGKQDVESEKGIIEKYDFQCHAPSDLLPPVRSHLLKFPDPSKLALPAGDQPPNT
jgi:hypothetical protein